MTGQYKVYRPQGLPPGRTTLGLSQLPELPMGLAESLWQLPWSLLFKPPSAQSSSNTPGVDPGDPLQ